MSHRCPICKSDAPKGTNVFPFCSARCKTIDLGRWARGDYCIPGAEVDPEDSEVAAQLKDGEDSESKEG